MRSSVIAIAVLLAPSSLAAQPADPLVATWTVNMAKSSFVPGPGPKSLTMTVVPSGDGYSITQDEVEADGRSSHAVIALRPDGKEYPVPDAPVPMTVATTRIDARTYERITRANGKVILTSRTVIAPDGKTRTTTTKGVDERGKPVAELIVYERK
jgi:hypothetical protein